MITPDLPRAMYRLTLLALSCLVAATHVVGAQSLAEVARREQARRQAIKAPARVYTNEDLRRPAVLSTVGSDRSTDAVSSAPTAAASPSVAPVPPTAARADEGPQQEIRDEQFWRTRQRDLETALTRNQVYLDALQSRANALATDFVNRDDPFQRAQVGAERQRVLAEMDRLRAEIDSLGKELAAFEEEARRAGVPPGWLR